MTATGATHWAVEALTRLGGDELVGYSVVPSKKVIASEKRQLQGFKNLIANPPKTGDAVM
jgi:hypothetical protein